MSRARCDKFVDAETAAASIADGATVGLVGGGGGLMEASAVFAMNWTTAPWIRPRASAVGSPAAVTTPP